MLIIASELRIKANKLTHEALKQITIAHSGANVGIFFDILENILGGFQGQLK